MSFDSRILRILPVIAQMEASYGLPALAAVMIVGALVTGALG